MSREFGEHATVTNHGPTDDPGPPPVQFSLTTLLAATAAVSVLFALAGRLSAVWVAALAWFALLAAAHVAANALGTRSAAHAPSRRRPDADRPLHDEAVDPKSVCAPTTQLGTNTSLGFRLAAVVAVGAVVGCIVGTTAVLLHNGGRLGWAAIALAAVSSSGIGAFLSFLASSCAKVAFGAWREAKRHSELPR